MKRIASNASKLDGLASKLPRLIKAKVTLDTRHGYPVLLNDAGITQHAVQALESNDVTCQKIPMRMTSEDFARYGQHGKPLTFFALELTTQITPVCIVQTLTSMKTPLPME